MCIEVWCQTIKGCFRNIMHDWVRIAMLFQVQFECKKRKKEKGKNCNEHFGFLMDFLPLDLLIEISFLESWSNSFHAVKVQVFHLTRMLARKAPFSLPYLSNSNSDTMDYWCIHGDHGPKLCLLLFCWPKGEREQKKHTMHAYTTGEHKYEADTVQGTECRIVVSYGPSEIVFMLIQKSVPWHSMGVTPVTADGSLGALPLPRTCPPASLVCHLANCSSSGSSSCLLPFQRDCAGWHPGEQVK